VGLVQAKPASSSEGYNHNLKNCLDILFIIQPAPLIFHGDLGFTVGGNLRGHMPSVTDATDA